MRRKFACNSASRTTLLSTSDAKGGKVADMDRRRAIRNLFISRVVIGVDGAQSFRTEPGACTLGKIISVRPYNTALLRACGDTEGLGPGTSRPTWLLVECLDYYAETECGHTFPETTAGLLGICNLGL